LLPCQSKKYVADLPARKQKELARDLGLSLKMIQIYPTNRLRAVFLCLEPGIDFRTGFLFAKKNFLLLTSVTFCSIIPPNTDSRIQTNSQTTLLLDTSITRSRVFRSGGPINPATQGTNGIKTEYPERQPDGRGWLNGKKRGNFFSKTNSILTF